MSFTESTQRMSIHLSEQDLIATGTTRSCYRHPERPGRCIKVDLGIVPGVTSHKEVRYFEKLKRIRPDFDYVSVARCYGWLDTNMGPGTAHDLVLNETDQQCSQTLEVFMQQPQSEAAIEKVRAAFDHFVSELLHYCIPIRDMNHKNLCVQKLNDGNYRLVAVDGVGHTHMIPVIDYSRWYARKKIHGYLDRFGLSQTMFDTIESC